MRVRGHEEREGEESAAELFGRAQAEANVPGAEVVSLVSPGPGVSHLSSGA